MLTCFMDGSFRWTLINITVCGTYDAVRGRPPHHSGALREREFEFTLFARQHLDSGSQPAAERENDK